MKNKIEKMYIIKRKENKLYNTYYYYIVRIYGIKKPP